MHGGRTLPACPAFGVFGISEAEWLHYAHARQLQLM